MASGCDEERPAAQMNRSNWGGYCPLDSEQHTALVPRARGACEGVCTRRSSVLLLALLTLAAGSLLVTPRARLRSQLKGPLELQAQACRFEHGVDYSGHDLRHVPNTTSAEACRGLCEGEPKCSVWTWGEVRKKPFVTDVCFLKELAQEKFTSGRKQTPGVVSGRPCSSGGAPASPASMAHGGDGLGGLPTLFCFTLMLPTSDEKALLALQVKQGASIFACEEHAVFSNVSLELAPGLKVSVVALGNVKTLESTAIFLALWTTIIRKGRFRFHDWTVKVDPACVFFPLRFRKAVLHLKQGRAGSYINHCPRGLGGAVEALSQQAVRSLAEGASHCMNTLRHECGSGSCDSDGERFIDQCLSKVLKIKRDEHLALLSGDSCNPPNGARSCSDRSRVAFDHFDEVGDYLGCLLMSGFASIKGGFGVPPAINPPLKDVLHRAASDGVLRLYCWALLLPSGEREKELLALQYVRRTSLFACDEFAVYSSKSVEVTPGLMATVVPGGIGSIRKDGIASAENFRPAWRALLHDRRYLSHDWTVKVEPACVFLPGNLRTALKQHSDSPKGVYLSNCKGGLLGSIEVLSHNAVHTYALGQEHCENSLEQLCKGPCPWEEDLFMDQCLSKVLGVQSTSQSGLLTDERCDPPAGWKACNAGASIALHPFKDPKDYGRCLDSASGSSGTGGLNRVEFYQKTSSPQPR